MNEHLPPTSPRNHPPSTSPRNLGEANLPSAGGGTEGGGGGQNDTKSQMMLCDAHVVIVGLGLMGASLGYDLRGHCRQVTGLVRRPESVTEALASGCVDQATTDPAVALPDADLVILATPVRVLLRQIVEFGPLLRPEALLTDMGSTKAEICEALQAASPQIQVIGGHPMCGKEQSGLVAAESGLYRGCTYVLCPLPRTADSSVQLMLELVRHIGARPLVLDPHRHDRLVAAISHLPYVVSGALVAHVAAVGETDATVWDVAASGFRDTSRVAASEVAVMLDILLTNRTAVLAAINDYQARLAGLRELLERGDEVGLRKQLESSAKARQIWQKRN